MKKFISVWTVLSVVLSPTLALAGMPDHFGQAIKVIEKSRTFSELIEKNKSINNKEYAQFILQESKKQKIKNLPVISKKTKHHYQIKSKGHTIDLEVLSIPEGRYSINKKDVVLDFSQSPQKTLDKIMSALYEKKTSFRWSPIPEAHAIPPLLYPVALLFGGMFVMVGALIAGDAFNCSRYEKAYFDCVAGKATYKELKSIYLPNYDTHASCPGGNVYYGKQLRDCIQRMKSQGEDSPSPNKVDQ